MSEHLLVLFDIDGTLINTGGAGKRALTDAFRNLHGLDDAFRDYSFAGRTDLRILSDALSRFMGRDPSGQDLQAVTEEYLRLLQTELNRTDLRVEVLPGVREILEVLRAQGAHVGLATGTLFWGARLKLSAVDLWDAFLFGGFGSDAKSRTELTRIGIQRGQARAGGPVARDRIFVFGDSPLDVEAARGAGARSIAVLTGWSSREEILAESPEFVLDDLSNTQDVLRILHGA